MMTKILIAVVLIGCSACSRYPKSDFVLVTMRDCDTTSVAIIERCFRDAMRDHPGLLVVMPNGDKQRNDGPDHWRSER